MSKIREGELVYIPAKTQHICSKSGWETVRKTSERSVGYILGDSKYNGVNVLNLVSMQKLEGVSIGSIYKMEDSNHERT